MSVIQREAAFRASSEVRPKAVGIVGATGLVGGLMRSILPVGAHRGRRLDGQDRVAQRRQGSGIAASAGADVEGARRRGREQGQDAAMDVGKGAALVLRHQQVGGLAIALGSIGGSVGSAAGAAGVLPCHARILGPQRRICRANRNMVINILQ